MPCATALVVAAAAVGCVTPMAKSEVDALTICRGVDLKDIRKSLLLNGYEVKQESADDLVTDFKQVSGYAGDRLLRRITVVKTGDQEYRFTVRLKEIRIDRPESMAITRTPSRRQPRSTVILDLRHPVEIENELDQEYYEERRSVYEETQREVCGR